MSRTAMILFAPFVTSHDRILLGDFQVLPCIRGTKFFICVPALAPLVEPLWLKGPRTKKSKTVMTLVRALITFFAKFLLYTIYVDETLLENPLFIEHKLFENSKAQEVR
jgi:hypothetical protein